MYLYARVWPREARVLALILAVSSGWRGVRGCVKLGVSAKTQLGHPIGLPLETSVEFTQKDLTLFRWREVTA